MKCSVRPQASSFPPPAEVDEEVVQGHAAQLQAELLGVHVRRAGARAGRRVGRAVSRVSPTERNSPRVHHDAPMTLPNACHPRHAKKEIKPFPLQNPLKMSLQLAELLFSISC